VCVLIKRIRVNSRADEFSSVEPWQKLLEEQFEALGSLLECRDQTVGLSETHAASREFLIDSTLLLRHLPGSSCLARRFVDVGTLEMVLATVGAFCVAVSDISQSVNPGSLSSTGFLVQVLPEVLGSV